MRTEIDKIEQAVEWINQADGLLVTAGAGMGIDSGLPDFRGPQGFWTAYPTLRQRGIGFTDIASQATFANAPRVAWGFYGHRLDLYRRTQPHEGFAILREFGKRMPQGVFVYTSNVDGQFQKAGFSDTHVMECHGSIHTLQCLGACTPALWPADLLEVRVDQATGLMLGPLPGCPHCGRLARPNILLFDDWSWLSSHTDLQQYRLSQWLATVTNLVIIELGAGIAIPRVRRKSEALRARLIRINPTDAGVRNTDAVGFADGALATLRRLAAAVHSDVAAPKQ